MGLMDALLSFQGEGLGYKIVQRICDIAGSVLVLTLTAPLFLVIAIMIKIDSHGPILYKPERIGRNRRRKGHYHYTGNERREKDSFGQPFVFYKFRTMYADAKERFPELYAYNYSQEELATLPTKILVGQKDNPKDFNDPRITCCGRWLRKTSLDELPNFINVLKGDMHLVGPRPDIIEHIKYYSEKHLEILSVKPGVTGLAQINGRGRLSFLQTNDYDLEYVKNRSLKLDVKIMLKTIIVVFKSDGAL